MTAGRQDEHRVKRLGDQFAPISAGESHTIVARAGIEQFRRQIAQRRDFEQLWQLAQVVQVHDLGDQSTADDAYLESRRHVY